MEQQCGRLYLVATPLGNLEDISFRALRILREVDLIAAEDTRHTLKLLNHFEIKRPLISYHQHNERERAVEVLDKIQSGGNVALVSDAGMPGISDPGNWLVTEAVSQGIIVVPIPGPSAVITALAASGLDSASFYFCGFLPRRKKDQVERLTGMKGFPGTLIFYEAPHRIVLTLKNMALILGERRVVIARELTKIHEEFIRGTFEEIISILEKRTLKGEFTVLVEGNSNLEDNRQNSTNPELEILLNDMNDVSRSLRQNLKVVAQKTGKTTKEIYQIYLQNRPKK